MIIKPDTIIGGRYTIESLIATGGMGQVWMANDTVLDRKVAIKILKAEFSADRNFLTRFREEARTTARLNHPNIVSVYDYGEFHDTDGGDPIAYLVMELVHAESLSHALGRLTTLTVAQALDMLSQTAQGLSAAHEEGIIHRDVKPGNILITPRGRVKISDFGIAKAVDSVPITRTGTVMGTAQYISPEQAVGKDATSASDIYSLGIVGYEALCGKRPFDGEGSVSAAMAHVTASPNPLPNSTPSTMRMTWPAPR
ncbi:serine/threonine-protein kinase, partial [Lawsonella clevelandensis]|uniref:serine/threonine-protein kinase n=1 Tax=Lawsonella clevelandensis TaxID=1528099 RepID=UPI0023F2E0BB